MECRKNSMKLIKDVGPLYDSFFLVVPGSWRIYDIGDMIKIRYRWHLHRLPENCECGQKINFEHALSCKKGGFITIRHNQVRYITANLLKIISNDVKIEAPLLPLSGESLSERTANIQDSAWADLEYNKILDRFAKDVFWRKSFQYIS